MAENMAHEPPAGAEITANWTAKGLSIDYVARGGWIVLRKEERPAAELFSVSYVARGNGDRPVTFVFNGGPGASSAYLHMGAVGPSRVSIPADGSLPRMPPRLLPNDESWLAFTDLVFVDPVGTGFSRVVEDGAPHPSQNLAQGNDRDAGEYFGYKGDLESLCEFMARWLSAHGRWGSAVFIAGESYGGYRVGRLVRMLQERTGIGLSGAVLISPALELSMLYPSDYDVLAWVDLLPTMSVTAVHHGRSRAFETNAPIDEILRGAERFATGEYAVFLTRGASMPAVERGRVLGRLADLLGLPVEMVERAEGRVAIDRFARELLRDERRVLGVYDATITSIDPFPDREPFAGPDPTDTGIESTYTAAINRQLRQEIGVETDREYTVLKVGLEKSWRNDESWSYAFPPSGATDDLRYGMSLNPSLRTFIAHGRYDLITPYYASDRLRNLMRLDPEMAGRLTVRQFAGGHMFYAWEESRVEFTAAMAAFVADAVMPV